MTYLLRVATMTLRALNGVSQLVLMCARTPEAVRNCSSAMSSRSATALLSCGCTSTISESVKKRIRSMSCTARSITTPTFDMRGGNGPTRVMAIDRMSSSADRLLDRFDRRIEAFDMPDHQGHAGAPRGRNDRAPLLHRGCDRLLDQHVHAAVDAGLRQLAMQVRGRGDGGGVDAGLQQRLDIAIGRAAQHAGHKIALLAVGIGDADELHPGKIGKHARMVAAHDADAHHTDS